MFKTAVDVTIDVKKNGNELQTKVSKAVRERALAVRPGLKLLEMYAKDSDKSSYLELLGEYNAASDALTDLDSEFNRLNSELVQASDDFQEALLSAIQEVCNNFTEKKAQLHAAIQANGYQREIQLSKIAVVAEGLRTFDSRADAEIEQLKSQIERQNAEIEELKQRRVNKQATTGKTPDPDYKELMIYQYGRNKALNMLREEGYDV